MSLEDSDNVNKKVVLVFEQLLYDVCEVLEWFVWEKLARDERFKDLDFKAQEWKFYGQLWFLRV